jgi:hypothetical protein
MKYIQIVKTSSSTRKVEHDVACCLKCGGDDIKIEEYEDGFGFISTATCNKCKNKVQQNTTEAGIIKFWNGNNHIPTLIKIKKTIIAQTKKEINQLVKLQNKRMKKKK